jgi:predicted TIM-barrel fold metal-dependent hydrolase
MARLGAFIEHAYIGCTPLHPYYTHEQVAAAIRAAGPSQCILSTDLGQAYNPAPAEGFRAWIALMLRAGFTSDEVEVMVKRNPSHLLGLA